jgi:hypothetical protein
MIAALSNLEILFYAFIYGKIAIPMPPLKLARAI